MCSSELRDLLRKFKYFSRYMSFMQSVSIHRKKKTLWNYRLFYNSFVELTFCSLSVLKRVKYLSTSKPQLIYFSITWDLLFNKLGNAGNEMQYYWNQTSLICMFDWQEHFFAKIIHPQAGIKISSNNFELKKKTS